MTRKPMYRTKSPVLSDDARAAFEASLAITPFAEPTPPDAQVARRRGLANGSRATRRYSKAAQEKNSFLIGPNDQVAHARDFTDSPWERVMRGNRKVVTA